MFLRHMGHFLHWGSSSPLNLLWCPFSRALAHSRPLFLPRPLSLWCLSPTSKRSPLPLGERAKSAIGRPGVPTLSRIVSLVLLCWLHMLSTILNHHPLVTLVPPPFPPRQRRDQGSRRDESRCTSVSRLCLGRLQIVGDRPTERVLDEDMTGVFREQQAARHGSAPA
ncbi:hypothetical protein L228DRAFT_9057 [Xylona heveae TC161]|uniref:Uncharacterized protein n=1 Tax=Xylona heveae (strain CBS 132557 / TC161) TaxID=1328760 RepID=A0A165JIL1_XYLHT|nr:hypothetical protein L228DRAFT_9057 [Xylona heveae TC161]KZF26288.1 hypothetical protein L228DRAFT_9057 [Xylona heveae TC161]